MKTYYIFYISATNPTIVDFWSTIAEDHIDAELQFNDFVEENDLAVEIKGINVKSTDFDSEPIIAYHSLISNENKS